MLVDFNKGSCVRSGDVMLRFTESQGSPVRACSYTFPRLGSKRSLVCYVLSDFPNFLFRRKCLLSSTKGNSTFFVPSRTLGYLTKERQLLKLELPRTGSFVTFQEPTRRQNFNTRKAYVDICVCVSMARLVILHL
jgi:hypothetical protein